MEVKHDILWRVYLSFIGVVILCLCVVGRAFYIQDVQGDHWRNMSDSLHQKYVALEAERGTIYSEDGEMLSTSVPYYNIYIDFGAEGLRAKNGKNFRQNIDSFSLALSNLFQDQSPADYKQDLKAGYQSENRYFPLKKNLSFQQYKQFRNFPLVKLGRNESGVIVEVKSRRLNPFGILGRRTIGLSRENAQNVGLERTYDSVLTGTNGKQLVRVITGGAPMPVEGYEIEAENGKDIVTTIDMHIQDIVEASLMKMMVQSESEHGTCIVMETKTGKIKAIANLGKTHDRNYDETYNYALQTTEPGSTIKLATLLAVLDNGSSKLNDMVEVGSTGHEFVGVRDVNDAERAPRPLLSVKECFAHSSNVGFSKLAYKAFGSRPLLYKSYLQKFHLDQKTGIDLLGEETPKLPKINSNSEGIHAMITASFGYAIQISPLNTLMLYNTIANNGRMMKPYLVSSIKSNGITVKEFSPTVVDSNICKKEVLEEAKECMVAVTTEGTGKEIFKNFPFPVAGKTGTAHVAGGGLTYNDGVYQASFIGFFPANDPQYTCIVVIKTKPHAPLHFGGQLAAPVFKDVATQLYAMYVQERKFSPLQIIPDSSSFIYSGSRTDIQTVLSQLQVQYADSMYKSNWSNVYSYNYHTVAKGVNLKNNTMPDVRHMTLKDAVYALENMGLKVSARGRGKVVAQDIAPGATLTKRKSVTLLLN